MIFPHVINIFQKNTTFSLKFKPLFINTFKKELKTIISFVVNYDQRILTHPKMRYPH